MRGETMAAIEEGVKFERDGGLDGLFRSMEVFETEICTGVDDFARLTGRRDGGREEEEEDD